MENKKLNRVFDQVKLSPEREEAMLADLLAEKKEVSRMKQTNRRRIPVAAFVAAVLVIALAGTALAAGYFGRASVVPDEDSYSVYGTYHVIPEESLPEEIRALGAEIADHGVVDRPFTSRAECEEFLGLKLAANPRLEALPPVNALDWSEAGSNREDTQTSSGVGISFHDHAACTIDVISIYGGDGYQVTEQALIRTDKSGVPSSGASDIQMKLDEEWTAAYEDYTTPRGLEASIVTSTQEIGNIFLNAYFSIDNALYQLDYMTHEEHQSVEEAVNSLKEILDAYE